MRPGKKGFGEKAVRLKPKEESSRFPARGKVWKGLISSYESSPDEIFTVHIVVWLKRYFPAHSTFYPGPKLTKSLFLAAAHLLTFKILRLFWNWSVIVVCELTSNRAHVSQMFLLGAKTFNILCLVFAPEPVLLSCIASAVLCFLQQTLMLHASLF